eukprot:GHVP01069414.1.p1 GENE.GHVP01069414.1~~GHVP01069414.1.p1  ORF type:complete len:102 (-),score=14.34 GHVP01069414.1:1717-2022(-)
MDALWKGATKFLSTMKKFQMSSISILSDNMTVVDAFAKNTRQATGVFQTFLDVLVLPKRKGGWPKPSFRIENANSFWVVKRSYYNHISSSTVKFVGCFGRN